MTTLQFYSTMLVALDGWLQQEQTGVSVWSGIKESGQFGHRVEVTWAFPEKGFEWDGRLLLGTDRTVRISVFAYSFRKPIGGLKELTSEAVEAYGLGQLANMDMLVKCFEVSKPRGNKQASVRAVFECDARPI